MKVGSSSSMSSPADPARALVRHAAREPSPRRGGPRPSRAPAEGRRRRLWLPAHHGGGVGRRAGHRRRGRARLLAPPHVEDLASLPVGVREPPERAEGEPMSQHVLAIDDSPDVHRLLDVRVLQSRGPRPSSRARRQRAGVSAMARQLRPDLASCSTSTSRSSSGFEVLSEAGRSIPCCTAQIPVIFLTGKQSEVYTKVQGFPIWGAIDYVTRSQFEPWPSSARERGHGAAGIAAVSRHPRQWLARTSTWPHRASGTALVGFDLNAAHGGGVPGSAALRAHRLARLLLDIDHFKSR